MLNLVVRDDEDVQDNLAYRSLMWVRELYHICEATLRKLP